MSFQTLPRSSGKSAAAQRMIAAGEALQRAQAAAAPAAAGSPRAPRLKIAGARPIVPIELAPHILPNKTSAAAPRVRLVDPTELYVEEAYQRDLSLKSTRLIHRILEGWSWAKFKPPICAETKDGLFVIDGQHTAIAAATHPGILQIPVLIVSAAQIRDRAAAFVAHNRDRLVMSQFQVFHAEIAAGDKEAVLIAGAVAAAGASIPRNPVGRDFAKPGQILSVAEVRTVYRRDGPEVLTRLLAIATRAGVAPVPVTIVRALRAILCEEEFADIAATSDDRIAAAIRASGNLDVQARRLAEDTGQTRHRACAVLISKALQ